MSDPYEQDWTTIENLSKLNTALQEENKAMKKMLRKMRDEWVPFGKVTPHLVEMLLRKKK